MFWDYGYAYTALALRSDDRELWVESGFVVDLFIQYFEHWRGKAEMIYGRTFHSSLVQMASIISFIMGAVHIVDVIDNCVH